MISRRSVGRNLRRRPRLRTALIATTSAAALAAMLLTAPASARPPAGATQPAVGGMTPAVHGPGGAPLDVTLITGDQVELSPTAGGGYGVATEPAPRQDGSEPEIEVTATDDDVYALPSDVLSYLDAGVLDRELFNVTKLAEYGYTDGVPVIVTHQDAGTARRSAGMTGASVTATLSSIDAVAATIEPGGAWWTAAQPAEAPARMASGPLAGVEKVWLDELAEVTLDESVPLVGAPEAWAAGYDGTGLTIAVLDTGIDAGHPDLAGKVIEAENFTSEPDATDEHGHGTHVSGIVAGTGAASGGAYTGVAPGAQLLNGKICDAAGDCLLSGIIAGMEWAADRADVVNMSVGTAAGSDGTDPISQAVNTLTDQHDVLFVVAAGNSGSQGEGSVGAPGAADAALTVGSVDKADQLAPTSSRGPRLGDFAIKPDITAPGVNIVSARAEGTELGPIVDEVYQQISGTSMATPHVAGAAAILAQQHPDWSATELKAALMAATVDGGHTVYQQGAGRLDVARAITQQAQVSPAAADFGFQPWPQEGPPQTRTLTYTNPDAEPVTLELNLTASTVGGDPLPAGVLTLDANAVTVPAGGAASVTLTLDHTAAEAGNHTGAVVATGPDNIQLRTPVGFSIGEELFTLDVSVRDRDVVDGFENIGVGLYGVDGSLTGETINVNCLPGCPDPIEFVVPAGIYHVRSWVRWEDVDGERIRGVLIDPEVVVTGDTGTVLDANDAEPISLETTQPSEPLVVSSPNVFRSTADGSGRLIASISPGPLDIYLTPTEPVTVGEFWTTSHWLLGPPGAVGRPAYVYQLKLYQVGHIPESLHYTFSDDELASVDNHVHADESDTPVRLSWVRWRPDEFAASRVGLDFTGPTTLREYVGPLSSDDIHDRRLETEPPIGPFRDGENTLDVYDQATHSETRWNSHPFALGTLTWPDDAAQDAGRLRFPLWVCVACRQGNNFYPFMHQTSPEQGHTMNRFGTPGDEFFDFATVRLFRDGEEIAQAPPFQFAFTTYELPPEAAEYRLTVDTDNISTAWGFTSSNVTEDATPPGTVCPETGFGGSTTPCRAEPLIFLRYDAGVDLRNTVPAPGAHEIQVTAYRQATGGPPITELRMWASTDDGASWTLVRGLRSAGDGTFTANIVAPPPHRTSGAVSLRAEAWDAAGNRVEQTILGAYGLRPRAASPR